MVTGGIEPVNGKPKYEGETVNIGGIDYVVPGLTVKQARALWPKIVSLNKGITEENVTEKYADAVAIIHAGLSRNYPDITFEQAEELVDMRNLAKLVLIVSGRSGLIGPGLEPAAAASVK